jgi:hypothetical protein
VGFRLRLVEVVGVINAVNGGSGFGAQRLRRIEFELVPRRWREDNTIQANQFSQAFCDESKIIGSGSNRPASDGTNYRAANAADHFAAWMIREGAKE